MVTTNILLVSYFAPSRGHAGGLRLLDLYRQIKRLQPQIHLELVTCHQPEVDWGCESLGEIFNNVHWLSPKDYCVSSIEKLGVLSQCFDVIDLQYHQSGALIGELRNKCPRSVIMFSPMESMIRAAQLYLHIGFRSLSVKRGCMHIWLALQEAYYVMRAEKVVCVSEPDRHALLLLKSREKIHCLLTGLSTFEFAISNKESSADEHQPASSKCRTLILVAYFGSRTNIDALTWFVKFVHPLIRARVPDYVLNVVGRGADADLVSLCRANEINFIGEVESIERELAAACVAIAPALTGAGLRGKINQYASAGLPSVASSVAAAGLKYESGKSILIADTPIDFAHQCVALILDENFRARIGQEAKRVCLENYTWQSMSDGISNIYNLGC